MASPSPSPSRTSPSPSRTSSKREHRGGVGGGRGMVEMELDAARVLADLAVSAGTGSESGGGSGTRLRKRSKSKSPSRTLERSFQGREDACSSSGYIATERRMGKGTNIDLSSEMIESSAKVSSSHSSSSLRGLRLRRNLTEAEKEERRLRRILANRESARQTIRRRQAHREELTKKVADFSVENENMKREKDLALKEYLSLKDTNEQLKEQIAQAMMPKAEINIDTSNADTESPPSSTNMPQFIICGKSPLLPIVYPSWSSTSEETAALFQQGNPSNVSGSSLTHCMSPCAWYYPLPHEFCSRGNSNVERSGTELSLMQPYEELEIAERASLRSTDEKENTVLGTVRSEKETATTAGAKGVTESSCKDDQALRPSFEMSVRMESLSTAGSSHDEKLQGACTWPSDKPLGTVAARTAAEARKRRKELTKLKQSQARQTGMHS